MDFNNILTIIKLLETSGQYISFKFLYVLIYLFSFKK